MPTYEYRCTSCGHEFEVFQKMTDPPKKRCPECRSKVEKKLSAGAGLIFKGSGFYITDYRSDAYKKQAKSESGEPSSGGTKPDASSGEKPAKGDRGSDGKNDRKPERKTESKREHKSDHKSDGKGSGTKAAKPGS